MYQGKVDLHLHLDGSLSETVVDELLKLDGEVLPAEAIRDRMRVPENCKSLVEYLQRFELPTQVLQTEYALERSAYELVERLASQGLVYCEIRFAPQLHTHRGLDQRMVVKSVLRGIAQAQRDYPTIRAGLLLCAMIGSDDAVNRQILDLAREFLGQGVVGIDLAGAECMFPLELYAPIYMQAAKEDIPFTLHAGETGSFENIRRSIELGARRVGHGCAAIKDERVMELLKRTGTVVEACVISNLQTKIVLDVKDHPMAEFYRRGIRVSVNTDNMTCSDTTLKREHDLLRDTFSFSDDDFRKMDTYAISGAFIPEAEKAALIAKL